MQGLTGPTGTQGATGVTGTGGPITLFGAFGGIQNVLAAASVQFGTTSVNLSGYTNAAGVITVPNTGTYLIDVDLQLGQAVTTMTALRNGATPIAGSVITVGNSSGTDVEVASVSFFAALTAGDTVEIRNGAAPVGLTQANITIQQVR